jgi:hypothetical protein
MGPLITVSWWHGVDSPEQTDFDAHHSLGGLTDDSSFPALVFPLALRSEFIRIGDHFSSFSPEPHRSAAWLHLSTASLFMI